MNGLTVIPYGAAGLVALLILLNWVGLIAFAVVQWQKPTGRGYSFAPPLILGPVLAAIWALSRTFPFRRYAFIAVFLDPSILLLLSTFVLGALRKLIRLGRGSGES